MTRRPNRPLVLPLRILDLPAPVRCLCGALLMRVHGPAQVEVKCRRCGRMLELRIS